MSQKPYTFARLRWKAPSESVATERAFPLDPARTPASFQSASASMRRAVAVAALAENLRHSAFRESWTLAQGQTIAQGVLDREQPDELKLLELYRLVAAAQPAGPVDSGKSAHRGAPF